MTRHDLVDTGQLSSDQIIHHRTLTEFIINWCTEPASSHLSQQSAVPHRDYPHPGLPASAAIALGSVEADGGWTKIENVNPLIKINGDNRAIGSVWRRSLGVFDRSTSSAWRHAWRHPRDVMKTSAALFDIYQRLTDDLHLTSDLQPADGFV